MLAEYDFVVLALLEAARRTNFREVATQIATGFASGRYLNKLNLLYFYLL